MFTVKIEIVSDKKGFRVENLTITNINGLDHHAENTRCKIINYLAGEKEKFYFVDGRKVSFKSVEPRVKSFKKEDMVTKEEAINLMESIEKNIKELKGVLMREFEKRPYFYISKEF
jgi:hypothetical protein